MGRIGLSFLYGLIGWLFGATAAAILLLSGVSILKRQRRRALVMAVSNLSGILIVMGILIGIAYFAEVAFTFFRGDRYEAFIFFRVRWNWLYALEIAGTVLASQLFWCRKCQSTPWLSLVISLTIVFTLNLEHIVMLITAWAMGDAWPNSWR